MLRFMPGYALVSLVSIVGCGGSAGSSGDAEQAIRAEQSHLAAQGAQDRLRKLSEQVDKLGLAVLSLEQSQATGAQQAATDQAALKITLDRINQRLDELTHRLEKIPIETKLQMNMPADVRGTLEDALAEVSRYTTIPIRIELADLKEANIPKIRYVELAGGQTAEKLLGQAMREANLHRVSSLDDPLLALVYVVARPADTDRPEIVVTTRAHAARRGKLPAAFSK